jgi:hypothetical protein
MGSWGLPAALRTLGADDVLACHAFLAVEISVRSVRVFDAFAEFPRPVQALAMRLAACLPAGRFQRHAQTAPATRAEIMGGIRRESRGFWARWPGLGLTPKFETTRRSWIANTVRFLTLLMETLLSQGPRQAHLMSSAFRI